MGLVEVMKKMKKLEKLEKKSGSFSSNLDKKYPTSKLQKGKGFRPKPNSQEGAARQRSMGNRNVKSG